MNSEVDYSAVERAMAQNDAPARMRLLAGQGIRAFTVLIGVGIAAVLMGWGWKLAKDPKIVEKEVVVEKEVIVEVPASAPVMPQVSEPENEVVRNYVIFDTRKAKVGGKDYIVTVGHNYDTSTQKNYSDAFCYTNLMKDQMQVRIELSRKMPGEVAVVQFDGGATRAGLSGDDVNKLRAECPYQWR